MQGQTRAKGQFALVLPSALAGGEKGKGRGQSIYCPCPAPAPGSKALSNITATDIAEMLAAIPPRPPYSDWLRIASAVWSVLPMEEGCRLLAQWSPEEIPGEYAAKHKSRLHQVGIGTLFYFATKNGWNETKSRRPDLRTFELTPVPSGTRSRVKLNLPSLIPSPALPEAITPVPMDKCGEPTPRPEYSPARRRAQELQHLPVSQTNHHRI